MRTLKIMLLATGLAASAGLALAAGGGGGGGGGGEMPSASAPQYEIGRAHV